jgi:hypothetical protein
VTDAIGLSNGRQVEAGQRQLADLMAQAKDTGAQNQALFGQYRDLAQNLYGNDVDSYNQMVARLSGELAQPADSFSYNQDVNSFLDPAREQRVSQAMAALNASAAGGGSRWSSDFQNRMAAKQQALASDEWKNAYDRMMADRQQQLNEWQAGQSSKYNRLNAMQGLTNTLGQQKTAYGNAMGDYYGNMASQNNATLSTLADLGQASTNLGMQREGGIGSILNAGGKILGGIYGV